MRRFELGMSLDYAGSWEVVDAVREFFQNAIDEEKENPENKMSFLYNESEEVLTIGNLKSKLTPRTLLLGVSSKRGNKGLIGEHGEGYKVATVVLVRNGVTVNIYNNESKEVWTSKVVNSKRYGESVVCFDIEKKLFSKKENLVIELVGITREMYDSIVESNLHLQEDLGTVVQSSCGRILEDPRYSGKIFVEGLYVCTKGIIEKGYDFNASEISLDRDRGLVDTFDLKFAISNMYIGVGDSEYISKNIKSKDLEYIASRLQFRSEDNLIQNVANRVYSDFLSSYGEDAIPVDTAEEFNFVSNNGGKAVMVESQVYSTIKLGNNDLYKYLEVDDVELKFNNWVARNGGLLGRKEVNELLELWKLKGRRVDEE